MDFRFSNLYLNSGTSFHISSGMAPFFLSDFVPSFVSSAMSLNMQDCATHNGWINLGEPNPKVLLPVDPRFPDVEAIPGSVRWFNNLFDAVNINLDPNTGPSYWGTVIPWPPSTWPLAPPTTSSAGAGC
jgi:hypothetical protein